MKKFLKTLFCVLMAIYPILIFTLLVVLKVEVKIVSLCIIVVSAIFFLSVTGTQKSRLTGEKKGILIWKSLLSSILFLITGLFCFFTGKELFLRFYSIIINCIFLVFFSSTLFFKPNIIFRFAVLTDKKIIGSSYEKNVNNYCKKVTVVWCCFFILNGIIAACTTFFYSQKIWAIYNGGISYVLMGTLFIVEFLIRKVVDKKMIKTYPITKFTPESRKDDFILCYENNWSSQKYKNWKDFLIETTKIRSYILKNPEEEYILHCEDYWNFLCVFVALLQCKKSVYLTQNITDKFLQEVKTSKMRFLTDQNCEFSFADFVQDILNNSPIPTEEEFRKKIAIDCDLTKIFLFTSGSTGRPKAIVQRMTEFEIDNAFIISKWGNEFTKRKLLTTVSQHHIYGFLFGISLPFTLGVPFRRQRVEFPEEFSKLTDTSYIIISTPAFLKRTCDFEEKLNMQDTFIFTSGGAVGEELAQKTENVFGFCPLEVYGSTETSGIAYRQQNKDKLFWTPFDNAKIWLGDDGCLRIISPYIKNPDGFATADLAEIQDDGRFLLKGRSDSIVKIEEKRISLTEVENRLLESNLVREAKVVALSNDVRQFLGAVIVLNNEGKSKFNNSTKLDMNKYFHDFLMNYFENVVIPKKWRFLEKLPTDVQGKVHKLEIMGLFV